jgi:signal transduction histidine kinase
MVTVEERLCNFLEENVDVFLQEWRQNVKISQRDKFYERIINNGIAMYHIIIRLIKDDLDDEEIKRLAYMIANERVEANVNIGEFVYNVNLGRSEILGHLDKSNIPLTDLQPIINKMNQCFDQFIYHSVVRYTELKNHDLKEKQTFIEQTHKDRLTILGQMSSSFVHEFRNPLTAIMGFVKILRSDYPSMKYLDIIDRELAQLNFRITQFLMASKKDVIDHDRENFSFNELFEEIIDFLYPSLVDGEVVISTSISPNLFYNGFREELRQVFMNIIINSIDALQQMKKDRKISIEMTKIDENITIHISNNGPAIPTDSINTIFEPFVTTKQLGTGIGLFVCKKIVDKHNGRIEVHSNDDLTTFSIYL